MEAARPRSSRRRPRRGPLERPLNTRLVRAALIVLVPPLVLCVLTLAVPGSLPAPALPAAFDGATATRLAGELASDYPNRVPGTTGAAGAARWVEDSLGLYGLDAVTDTWREDVPGLGDVELRNLVTVVEGAGDEALLVVAHRDNDGEGPGANVNASGTAALIELARAYGVSGTGGGPVRPQHTLVFLSSDGGAYGDLGAARFAATSPLRDRLLAVVSLDGLAGRARVRLAVNGGDARTAAPALVRTASLRVEDQTGRQPELPGLVRQLVDLALPFAVGEQAPFLAQRVSAVRLTTVDDAGADGSTDEVGALDAAGFARLGRAAQELLGSLDAGVELAPGTAPQVLLGERVLRGWALALLLAAAVLPPALGVVDLLARLRRQGVPLAPALRALRSRLGVWLLLGALLWLGARAGVLPSGGASATAPQAEVGDDWRPAGVALLAALAAAAWWLSRRRLAPRASPTPEELLAGHAAGLLAALASAALLAPTRPLTLLFVVPSLYAWLWLPQLRAPWRRDVLFGLGFAGPVLAVVSLAERFDLGLAVVPYAVELVTTGYLPAVSVVAALVWAAAAAQVGAVAAGRYAPYAGGATHPPPGLVRGSVRRAALAAQARRR